MRKYFPRTNHSIAKSNNNNLKLKGSTQRDYLKKQLKSLNVKKISTINQGPERTWVWQLTFVALFGIWKKQAKNRCYCKRMSANILAIKSEQFGSMIVDFTKYIISIIKSHLGVLFFNPHINSLLLWSMEPFGRLTWAV